MTRTIAGGGTAELEVGKTYLNRLGLACRIVYRYKDETGRMYYSTGACLAIGKHDNDLIEEV